MVTVTDMQCVRSGKSLLLFYPISKRLNKIGKDGRNLIKNRKDLCCSSLFLHNFVISLKEIITTIHFILL